MKPEHKKIFESLTEWQLMGLCIEREASGEPYDGRVAVGTVILERVDHRNWDGKTIKEVVLCRWQFSWTMPEAGEDYYETSVWIASNWVEAYRKMKALQECCEIAVGMMALNIPRDPELAAAHCCQYMNPKTAEPGQEAKLLKAGMKIIKDVGAHRFYA
ncbi:MAG: cell wall hydrolase [Deltaproteobacteria bacterium]|nr:cell wall hydrolase [Deltaproteobacteria bacterium]